MGSVFQEDNDYFERFLDMIPSRIYYPPQPPEDAWKKKGQRRKKPSKGELRQREKRRKAALFDPTKCRTILQMQRDMLLNDRATKSSKEESQHSQSSKDTDSSSKSDSMLDIRRRYREKLDSFKKRRSDSKSGDDRSQKLNQSKVKSNKPVDGRKTEKMKRKRTQDGLSEKPDTAETEFKHSDSLHKKKKRRKENNKAQQDIKHKLSTNDLTSEKATKCKPAKSLSVDSTAPSNATEANDIMFGNISKPKVLGDATKKKINKAKKATLLKKLEARDERLSRLSDADAEKARTADGIDAAIKRARGEKVVDNVAKLKKTMKKKEKQREKHAKEWKERKKLQRDIVKSAADKRRENIEAHTKKKKKKIQKPKQTSTE